MGPQVYELKIGQSFINGASAKDSSKKKSKSAKKGGNGADFHTIRYDFKPASIDDDKMGSLVVAPDGKSVSVSMPTNADNDVVNYG